MKASDTRSLYEEVANLSLSIKEREQASSIIFADLVGSTDFKAVHGAFLGLQKTFIHNSVITKESRNVGNVVKYIGDEVMIVTQGNDHALAACELAIRIQQSLLQLNQRHSDDARFPIISKIGIHSGPVQYWKYPDHEPLDPQGTTVDVAARMVSLAKGQQVLCTKECANLAKLTNIQFGPAVQRYVKGIIDPIDVVEILWDGTPRQVAQYVAPVTEDHRVRSLVREARVHVRTGNQDAALKAFQAALQIAPRDFNANLGLGELLMRRLGKMDEGRKFLEAARQLNPGSPAVLLIEGFLEWQQFRKTKDKRLLDSAITLTENCLELAEINNDYHNQRLGQGNLAYYLAERKQDNDLEHAVRLCEDTFRRLEGIRGRGTSEFLDTYAFTLLQRGTGDDVVKARKLLEDAIKCDPQNPFPYEHMAELIRKERKLNIKPPSGWDY